jgi:prevent-host-death family protein
MEKKITATEANRSFSGMLQDVREGNSYTITSHGQVVARIVPAAEDDSFKRRILSELIERARKRESLGIPVTWSRDDLYEDSE